MRFNNGLNCFLASLKFKSEHLTSPSFLAVNLNGKPVEDVVTLHTAQHFSSRLSVNELYLTGAIHVGGLVNRVKLPYEKENTLMVSGFYFLISSFVPFSNQNFLDFSLM